MKVRVSLLAGAVGIALSVCAAAQPKASAAAPAWGTTAASYVRIGAEEFHPATTYGPTNWGTLWNPGTSQTYEWLAPETGTQFYFSTPHLPDGALLGSLEMDACDYGGAQLLTLQLFDCDGYGYCTPTPLATVTSSADAGNACAKSLADLSSLSYTVNNANRRLLLAATFGAFDGTLNLGSAVVSYSLQVRPAPATPTFNDVPSSDFGFQYIEALAASGITGGCGGGSFCPDAPVTRRQMAIFIAKALGLNYPLP